MSQRLADRFAACREEGRIAFVGFVTAGFPNLADTVPAMLEMEKQGADRFCLFCVFVCFGSAAISAVMSSR